MAYGVDRRYLYQKVHDGYALDKIDPIPQAYMLEVSSPGIDRPLKRDKDFERFMGRDIDIGLYKPQDGSKTFTGKLLAYKDGIITIEENGKEINFEKKGDKDK